MKHITLILTIIALLACTNHKAQNTSNNPKGTTNQTTQTTSTDTTLLTPQSTFNIPKSLLLGKFNPAEDTNYVVIPDHMSTYKGLYCHREAFNAYLAMRDSALRDGITLTIISATRNFDRQLQIWNRKWQNTPGNDSTKIRSIMRYSSMPGTSRHHWGTDIDFISAETDYWTHGEGLRIYNWLCANAHKFGFFQPYTADPARTGYAEERWHWSYAPLSKPYLEAYRQKITAEDITGFSGSYLVDSLGIIQSHVFGITE